MNERIKSAALRAKIMSAADAAQFVNHGDKVGMSGFTGSAYPKALPTAIAERARAEHQAGREYAIDLFTGASTAPDCDGVLAEAEALRFRAPYQSDPTMRAAINAGRMDYADMHLSHSAQQVEEGFFGALDVAIVEVSQIDADGNLVPSSGVGNNVEYLNAASRIIVEVTSASRSTAPTLRETSCSSRESRPRRPNGCGRPSPCTPRPRCRCTWRRRSSW